MGCRMHQDGPTASWSDQILNFSYPIILLHLRKQPLPFTTFVSCLLFLKTINHFIIWICNQTSGRGNTKYAAHLSKRRYQLDEFSFGKSSKKLPVLTQVLTDGQDKCEEGSLGLLSLSLSGNLWFCGLIDPTESCEGRDLRPYYDFKCNIYPLALQNIKTAVKWLTPLITSSNSSLLLALHFIPAYLARYLLSLRECFCFRVVLWVYETK